MEKRFIGIDLHRNRFTCCIRLENERTYLTEWELEDLGKFVKKLRPGDEVAVEITGNTRMFFDAVAPHVKSGLTTFSPCTSWLAPVTCTWSSPYWDVSA